MGVTMTPIIHTTRPPNDDRWIITFCPTASQMEPTNAWSAVQLCARVTKAKYMQDAGIKWGAEVVPHNGIWHITQSPADDAPLCWCYATDLPALFSPPAPADGPDLAPELEAARAELARVRAAIAQLVEAAR